MSLAKATISGIVVGDPEKRYTPNNTAVTNFTIQVNPSGRNESSFHVRVACWRSLADTVAEKVHKGDDIVVEGRLQVNQYEGADGIVKRLYEVDANNIYLGQLQPLISPSESQFGQGNKFQESPEQPRYQEAQPANQSIPVGVAQANQMSNDTFAQEDLLTEDDIPF